MSDMFERIQAMLDDEFATDPEQSALSEAVLALEGEIASSVSGETEAVANDAIGHAGEHFAAMDVLASSIPLEQIDKLIELETLYTRQVVSHLKAIKAFRQSNA